MLHCDDYLYRDEDLRVAVSNDRQGSAGSTP